MHNSAVSQILASGDYVYVHMSVKEEEKVT